MKSSVVLWLRVLKRNLPFALKLRPSTRYAKNELFFVIAEGGG